MSIVVPVKMPKWGLSMQEGAIVEWLKAEGSTVSEGEDLVDIETSKITNVCESPVAGVLRRIVGQPGETLPVGALLGVVAEAGASDADVETFIADFQASFVPSESEEDSAEALKLSTVETPHGAIRFGRAGLEAGAPVVFIHGYSGDLNNWAFNVDAVGAAAPVIALDLPGHGGSTKAVGDGSLTGLAGALFAALEALKVPEAHLVGHSLGAAVALRMAVDHPALARSVTLIAPVGFSASGVSDEFLSGVIDAQRARDLKPVLEMLLADPAMVSKDMVEDVLNAKRVDGVEEALGILRDRMVAGDDAGALRRDAAGVKAVVIAAKGDRVVGEVDPALLPPGFDLVWIDGAGHMPHLEKAAEVNALLLKAIA